MKKIGTMLMIILAALGISVIVVGFLIHFLYQFAKGMSR